MATASLLFNISFSLYIIHTTHIFRLTNAYFFLFCEEKKITLLLSIVKTVFFVNDNIFNIYSLAICI